MEFDYNETILSVKDLEVQFNLRGQTLTAIRGISLDLQHFFRMHINANRQTTYNILSAC